MTTQTEPGVVMKDGDQLDADFSVLLIGWHREQKPRVGDGDLIAFGGSNEATTLRSERSLRHSSLLA